MTELAATRWTGRPGYPIRAMVGMALAKSLHTLATWTRTVGLVREHTALRAALGCPDAASVPSVHACYRFTAKLRRFKPLLDACVDRETAAPHEQMPELGASVAIDASDMPAYGNGQRCGSAGSAPRSPSWTWGYDHTPGYEGFEARGCHPVIPLRETPAVKAGRHLPPGCAHGAWTFAGSDAKRQAAKWRCPTGECSPASRWITASRLHTLIPPGDGTVEAALPAARRGRAGERPAQARVGPAARAGPSSCTGWAPRRPDHPRPARLRARHRPRDATRRVMTNALAR